MKKATGKFQIMIIPPSTDGVRQFSIPQWMVPGVIFALTLVLLATVISTGLAMRFFTRAEALAEQVGENAVLRSQLANLDTDFQRVQSELKNLETSEERVRMVFGFPEIDPAERALGIGGFPIPFNEETTSELDLETFGVESKLDRLIRQCEFERENFEAIFDALTDRKERLDRTPSILPVTGGYISRGYGNKPDPFTGQVKPHTGLDVAAHKGTPIRAPADGRIISAKYNGKMGRVITIDHGGGIRTIYGHLSKFADKGKKQVRRGEIIGFVGTTGYSTGPHLHYEVHVNGQSVDPMKYIYDSSPWIEPALGSTQAENDAS